MGGIFSQKQKARDETEQCMYTIPIDNYDRVYQSLEQEGRGLENETLEEEIERLVYANIEQICICVNVMEILPYLRFLEDTGTFRERWRHSKRDSVHLLIQRLKESKEPRKWQCFLDALRTKGYGHVTNLILGLPESNYIFNKSVLTMMAPELRERMDPDEIVDKLLAAGLISEEDNQEIRCEERYRGKIAASSMILGMVPRRLDNWFSSFMSILEGCKGLKDITDRIQASELNLEKNGRAKQPNQDNSYNITSHRKAIPLPHEDTQRDISHRYSKVNKVNTKGVQIDFDQYEKDIQKQDKEIHRHGKRSNSRQKGNGKATFASLEETPKDISHQCPKASQCATRASKVDTRGVQTNFDSHQKEIQKRDKEIQRLKNELKGVKDEKSHKYHGHAILQRPTVMNGAPKDEKTVTSLLKEVLSRMSAIDSKFEDFLTEFKALSSKVEPCTSGHNRHSNDDSTEMFRDGTAISDDEHIYENPEECMRPEIITPNGCVGKGQRLKQNCTNINENIYEEPEQCITYDMATPNKCVGKPQIVNDNTINRAGVGNSSFNADDHIYESPDACITSESGNKLDTKAKRSTRKNDEIVHAGNPCFIAGEEFDDEPLLGVSSESARRNGCERNVESPTRKYDETNGVVNPLCNPYETTDVEPDTSNEFECTRRSQCGDNSSINADEIIYDTCSIAYAITGVDNPCVNAHYDIYEAPSQLIKSESTTPKGCVRKAERPKGAIGEIRSVANPPFNADEEHYDTPDLPISSEDNIYDSNAIFGTDEPMKHSRQKSNRPEVMKRYFLVVDEECDNFTQISANSSDSLY